ncbi:MAG: tetratricopeptide repeat protein, partial [Planctomycetes bacterium]|nr:tetratricopeptide repeat protein [Planctomycetota bacterium]
MKLALAILAVLLALVGAAGADPRAEAAKLNEEGIALVAAGEYEEAVRKIRAARALLPLDLTLRRNLATAHSEWGTALLSANRAAEAAGQFRLAAGLEPGQADLHFRLGLALLRAKDVTGARRAFEKTLFLDPASAPARAWLGQILYDEGSLVLAIREWEKALAADPARDDVRERLARARREHEAEREHETEDSAHFVISFDAGEDRSIGTRVLRLLEDAYEEIGADLGIRPETPVQVVLYGEKEFREVTGVEVWVGALYDGRIRIPVKNFDAAERRIRAAATHEYVHVAVRSVTDRCPAWLDEGMAQHFEGRDVRASRATARAAADRQSLPVPADLREPFTRFADAEKARLAYAVSHAFTACLIADFGADRVSRFLACLGSGTGEAEAFESAFHSDLGKLWE